MTAARVASSDAAPHNVLCVTASLDYTRAFAIYILPMFCFLELALDNTIFKIYSLFLGSRENRINEIPLYTIYLTSKELSTNNIQMHVSSHFYKQQPHSLSLSVSKPVIKQK